MRASAYAASEPITRQITVVMPAITSVLARPALKIGSMNTVWKFSGQGTSTPASSGHLPTVSDFRVTLWGQKVGGMRKSSWSLTRAILSTHSNGNNVMKAYSSTTA
jgi:hypothetical protein